MFEFLMEYCPFLPIFAGFSLEEYAWRFTSMMMFFIEYLLKNVGNAMFSCLSTTENVGGATLSSVFNTLLTNVENSIVPTMASLGMAIAVVFWLIGFIEMVTEDRMSPEMFMKSFAKLAVSIGLCTYAREITHAIRELGDAIAATVKDKSSGLGGTDDINLDIFSFFDDFNFYDMFQMTVDGDPMGLDEYAKYMATNNPDTNFLGIFGFALAILPIILIVCLVMICVCFIIQATRILEIGVRAAFLPLAFGLIADDGWRGAGGRYIKKYLAVCSQGAVLILIGRLTVTLMTSVVENTLQGDALTSIYMFSYGTTLCVAVGIACVSVMFKSIGFINDVFGA